MDQAPGILQIGIVDNWRSTDIGNQIRLYVVLRKGQCWQERQDGGQNQQWLQGTHCTLSEDSLFMTSHYASS
jgi:hypothetical protein